MNTQNTQNTQVTQDQSITSQILSNIDSTLDQMTERIFKSLQERSQTELNSRDKEYIKLSLQFDLIKSIEKYTLSSDQLVSDVKVRQSIKGNIEISCSIERDNKEYKFSTEAIYAGGYNIQRLHYRYITHTSLSKTSNNVLTSEYKNKIKRYNKQETIKRELERLNKVLSRLQKELSDFNNETSEERFKNATAHLTQYKWEGIVEGSIYKTEQEFYQAQEEFNQQALDRYIARKSRINEGIKSIKKDIVKQEQKLASL